MLNNSNREHMPTGFRRKIVLCALAPLRELLSEGAMLGNGNRPDEPPTKQQGFCNTRPSKVGVFVVYTLARKTHASQLENQEIAEQLERHANHRCSREWNGKIGNS